MALAQDADGMSDFKREATVDARGDLGFFVEREGLTVQFKLSMGWGMPESSDHFPMATDLGYHSPAPMYDGHKPMDGECPLVEGGTCYYDGTSLGAAEPYEILQRSGVEALWTFLEGHWVSVSEGRAGGFGVLISALASAVEGDE